MGLKVSALFIEGLPKKKSEVIGEEYLFVFKKLNNLSPAKLSIAFTKNRTIILFDSLLENVLTEKLEFSEFEKQVLEIFPRSTLISIVINETIDFVGFSLSTDNKKIRTKATVKGEILIDNGKLISTESNLYDNFVAELKKDNIRLYKSALTKFKHLNKIEYEKAILKLRDNIYRKLEIENEFNYIDGSLDNVVCEDLLNYFMEKTYFEIEKEINFYQLQNNKFNLLNDFKLCLSKSYQLHMNT